MKSYRIGATEIVCALFTLVVLLPPQGASAASITLPMAPFTGSSADVDLTFDDAAAGAGKMQVTVDVVPNPNIGDIRGVFLHIADESLIAGLSVVDPGDLTAIQFGAANSVINLGGGNNLNGGGTPCGCDMGFDVGTPGIGFNDIQSTTFVMMHASVPLTIAHFANEQHGVRLTSVGVPGGSRNGSSKLRVIPEPATMLLALAALSCCAAGRKRLA